MKQRHCCQSCFLESIYVRRMSIKGIQKMLPPAVKEPFTCDYCKSSYSNKRTLTQHIKLCCEKPLTSKSVPIKPKLKNNKDQNMQAQTRRVEMQIEQKSFICNYCKKSFRHNSSLNRHAKNCCTKEPLSSKPFPNRPASAHDGTQHSKKPTLASTDDDWPSWWYVEMSQPKKKLFRCDYCGRAFSTKSSVKRHIINTCMENPVRREEKYRRLKLEQERLPHVCTICIKRFRTVEELQLHRKIHYPPDPPWPRHWFF